MTLLDSRTSRVLFTALLFAVGLGFLYAARRTLILFLFAIFFAYLINPAVVRLEKLVHSRVWAITIIYLSLADWPGGIWFSCRSEDCAPKHPAGERHCRDCWIRPAPANSPARSANSPNESETSTAGAMKPRSGFKLSCEAAGPICRAWRSALAFARPRRHRKCGCCFWCQSLRFSFLRDGGNFHEVLLALVQSRSQREFLQDVLQDLNQMLAQFIRAQLTLAALSLLAYTSILGAMRVPYALMLGTAGGALEFVPLAGPALAGTAMMAVAVLVRIFALGLFCFLFLFVWRMVLDYVISPRVMGSKRGVASSGGAVWHSRWRRNCRNSGRVSVDSGDGQFADCLAALADLCRKTEVRSAQ